MGDVVNINCDCSIIGSYECSNMDNSCYLSGNYLKGKDKPNYPVPAIIYEVDFMYEWPSNQAIATVLWNNSNTSLGSIF